MVIKKPIFGKWNRDDDPADGPNKEWEISNQWANKNSLLGRKCLSEQEEAVLTLDDPSESNDVKLLREMAIFMFGVNGQVTREDMLDEILNNYPEDFQERITIKMIDRILDEF